MPTRNRAQSDLIATSGFDPLANFSAILNPEPPWDSIVDFATHRSFCNQRLYPRQLTLLKLIYLETESMTAYDLDVIEQWRTSFMDPDVTMGVQEDIWTRVEHLKKNGYRHFPHIEAIIGRRGSKGKIGGILGTEKLAYMFSLDNWQEHYGVSPGKDGYLSVVATNSIQAKKFQFADIRETVEACRYLQPHIAESKGYELAIRTPADVRQIAYLHKNKMPIDHQIASLHAVAMSSNSASGRGATGFANFYDEFAHMITGTGSQRSSEEIYNAYQPSLDQFGQDSLTYIPSSPFTMVGHFYTLYQQGRVLMPEYDPETGNHSFIEKTGDELGYSDGEIEESIVEATANPEMLVVQLPSWGLYEDYQKSVALGGPYIKRPIQAYNERMRWFEKSDPEKFKVERLSQFATVMDAFLNPRKVDEMFDLVEWRTPAKLAAQDQGRLDRKYVAHIDPGLTNANFAFAIGHLEDAPPDEEGEVWPHVIIDYLKVWKASYWPDHTINYVHVQREITEVLRKFPTMEDFTSDQWNSAGMLAHLHEEFGTTMRVHQETFTDVANQARMDRFKSAMNLGWVHAYRDDFYEGGQSSGSGKGTQCLLELECKFLHRKPNGKVDRQEVGPVTTKDLFDAVNVVVDKLLKESLDRWQRKMLGQHRPAVGSSDISDLRSGRALERLNALKTGKGIAATSPGGMSSARDKLKQQALERQLIRAQGRGAYSRLRGRS